MLQLPSRIMLDWTDLITLSVLAQKARKSKNHIRHMSAMALDYKPDPLIDAFISQQFQTAKLSCFDQLFSQEESSAAILECARNLAIKIIKERANREGSEIVNDKLIQDCVKW